LPSCSVFAGPLSLAFYTRCKRPDWSPVVMAGCACSNADGSKPPRVNVMRPSAATSHDWGS